MLCNDPLLTFLRRYGYNVVRLPRANLQPLQILSRRGTEVESLGDLATLMTGGAALPAITRDAQATAIEGSEARSDSVKADLGLGFLGSVIAGMGGSRLGLGGAYQKAKNLTFRFQDVKQDSVDLAAVDQYLSQAKVNPNSRQLAKLLDADGVYLVVSTLKSREIKVEADGSGEAGADVDLPEIQKIVGAKVGVKSGGGGKSSVAFEGEQPLIFAFQAIQLRYNKGEYEGFERVEPGSVAMRSLEQRTVETAASEAEELVVIDAPNSPFVRVADATREAASAAPGKRALVIGINSYPKLPGKDLKGCVSDANAMESLLKDQYGFAERDVEVLLDGDATRDGILAAFERLVNRTEQGDVVVIHYSGHGSQMTDREGDEPDGMDETIVPHDSGRAPNLNKDITDDEIFDLLRRLAARTENIAMIFDCCHSGTIDRDLAGELDRWVEPDTRPSSKLPKSEVDPETIEVLKANRESASTRSLESGSSKAILPTADAYVLIAGCRDGETSKEYRVAMVEGSAPLRHGALSYFLMQELRLAGELATYRDVYERAASRVTAQYFDQHPQLIGSADRELFGTRVVRPARYLKVARRSGERIELAGGAAHGVTVGSVWTITAPGQKAPEAAPALARVEVTQVGGLTSKTRVIEAAAIDEVHDDCRAFETEHAHSAAPLAVHVSDLTNTDAGRTAVRSMSVVLEARAGLLRRVDLAEEADARVELLPAGDPDARAGAAPQLGTLRGETWAVVGRDGLLMMRERPSSNRTAASEVIEGLEAIARYRRVLGLKNDNPSDVLAGKVDVRLLKRGPGGDWLEAQPGDGGEIVYRAGEPIAFRMINSHNMPIYVYLINLGVTYQISALFPPEGAQPQLRPGTFDFGTREADAMQLEFPDGYDRGRGAEFVMLIASLKPTDFSSLMQDSVRAASDRSGQSALEALLEETGAGTRGVVKVGATADSWTTVVRAFQLER